jgi:HSP20 family molecular chaperone IbpA
MASNDLKNWMWSEAFAMLDQAERLHRQFFGPTVSASGSVVWEPPVDVFETERCVWVSVVLPGVGKAGLEMRLDGNVLVVAGHRRLPDTLRGAVIHRLEIPQGRFERRITLPPGHFEVGRNELENGCFVLELIKQI